MRAYIALDPVYRSSAKYLTNLYFALNICLPGYPGFVNYIMNLIALRLAQKQKLSTNKLVKNDFVIFRAVSRQERDGRRLRLNNGRVRVLLV